MNLKKISFALILPSLFSWGQTVNWAPLSSEIGGGFSPFVNELNVYNSKLIACGRFSTAGTVPANVIAAWDGTSWSNLNGGFRKDNIGYTTITFNNELYLGGYFDSIGNIKVKNVAKWNGTSWAALGTGADNYVRDFAIYNNELYASGNFTVIGGVTANGIARWDGSNWHALGNGFSTPGYGPRDLCVYNNSLYVVGLFQITGCTSCQNIASWDGTSWSGVGANGLPLGNQALIEWNGKLITGSNNELSPPFTDTEVRQWDGTNLVIFSKLPSGMVQKFYIFNNELYFSGGGTPSTVSKWSVSTSSWIPVGTGPNKLTYALVEYNGELYCGGEFNTGEGSNLNYIGRLTNVSGLYDLSKSQEIKHFPNPVKDKLNIEYESNKIQSIYLANILGQILSEFSPISTEIDLGNFPAGVYFLNIQVENRIEVFKIIKQ